MTSSRILQEHCLDKLHHNMIIFFLVFIAGGLGAAGDPYHISIDCGGAGHGGRYWHREGSSTLSTAKGGLITARISASLFSYSLKLSPGQKIIRFHFQPAFYIGFESSKDLFSVEAGNSSLLADFSASVTALALAVNVVVIQFCVTVEENEPLNLAFSPGMGNSYAFVNEIEIISIPSTTSPCCDGQVAPNAISHIDSSTVLERVHYQHVKWGPVSSGDDIASMFGVWAEQPSVGEDAEIATNKTWRVSVDVGFDYMVRLHFCEIGLHMDFVLLVNGWVALTSADMLQQRRGNREFFWYNNYMVMDKELKQGDNISVSLHSRHEFLDRHGPLEGFEVFKMSSHHSPSWTLLSPLRFFSYITIILHICCIVFIVYLEGKMSQCEFTNEDNKPSSLSHRFSPAGILGICEYGGVGQGFMDCGREIVGMKPFEIDAKHRENKFWTVTEPKQMILVDKYIPNGKLADHHDKLGRKSNDFFPQQRHQICTGLSWALEYLHTCDSVIHRDLKPQNILLDANFDAKLSDFGLAKIFSESQSQDSTKLTGTRGYTGPGFIASGELTKKSDILSSGTLMLKVMHGRAAREPLREEDKCTLTTLAERTKVEDDDYDKSQQENMNLIVSNEKIDIDNHVRWISLRELWLHAVYSGDSLYQTMERLRTHDNKSVLSAQVEVRLLGTGLQQREMPQVQVPWVLGEGRFGRFYNRFMNSESDQGLREWEAKLVVLMESLTGSQKCQMPLGFRFYPTDEELIKYYLWMKLKRVSAPIQDIEIYNFNPWDLPKRSFSGESEWFSFSRWDRERAWGFTSRNQKAIEMLMPVWSAWIGKRSLMRQYILGAARGMHAEEESVIHRYFKALLLEELYRAKLSALAALRLKKSNPLKEWPVELGVLMDSQQQQMPLEIRFHPTDEEDYGHYSVGLFDSGPWDLPKWSFFGEQKWFFFIPRDMKRATSGHHKATGMHNPAVPKGIIEWMMMLEYMLEDDTDCPHRRYNDWLKHMIVIEYPPSALALQKLTFKSHWK